MDNISNISWNNHVSLLKVVEKFVENVVMLILIILWKIVILLVG